MSLPDTHVAILGGGCAGLSLAVRLAERSIPAIVIEPRTAYSEDRTWSFWRDRPDPFEDCVRAHWSQWRVSHGTSTARRRSDRLRYETVSSRAVYDKALRLCASSSVEVLLGASVLGEPVFRVGGDFWETETTSGSLQSRYLVDTRPRPAAGHYGQIFLGRELAFPRAVFDTDEVGLMEFRRPRRDRVDFLYTLPFAPDRALVEVTSFMRGILETSGETSLESWLDAEIDGLSGGMPCEMIREERGFIPMLAKPLLTRARPEIRRADAGIRGGAARPSTGYAFQRIQRSAHIIAERIAAGHETISVDLDTLGTRFMDRVFLRVIQRRPAAAPELFLKLFRNAGRDRLERFLSGSNAPLDRFAVVGALPPTPFLRELATP
ncbi:MAG: lycopene cyclase family protein [Paracoccaceae bacterium]